MTFNEYQEEARKTAIYDDPIYPVLGLAEEAGEVAGKFAKSIRDYIVLDRDMIVKELGDVLWMVSQVAKDQNITLQEIADANIRKLRDRQARGVISGSGDTR